MSGSYTQELEVAQKAVRIAAQVCQAVQQAITTESLAKKDKSPVTVADFASQAVICRELQAAFPDDPVIGEEDSAELKTAEAAPFLENVQKELSQIGIDGSPEDICGWIDRGGSHTYASRFWTLDPIDGTKGFLRGEQYAVSLALIVDGKIDVALLGCPNLYSEPNNQGTKGVLLYAVRGQGAWQVPLSGGEPQQIHCSSAETFSDARLCESVESGHSAHGLSARVADALGIKNDPVRLDSQAKYAVVARGDADIYLRLPTRPGYREKIWDHAGGVLVVEEAGGKVTDVTGKPLEFTYGHQLEENLGVIVTNGKLHEAVVSKVVEARQAEEAQQQ
ncbi:Histidinol-phosphatase [Polystyrenella longa]|uniref:3'(2'),5'-bisphosphate nucleotidase n=1 Tax=Polystyrenella longa TaxID=2528007 RepID=A0A518CIC2_9PLAN|nr:3'(2'),5'-bisphosphate nucleotidase [Polystyrenella longa]QDU78914.1 Histidinol-phosphatase [Polystyrenella longa]